MLVNTEYGSELSTRVSFLIKDAEPYCVTAIYSGPNYLVVVVERNKAPKVNKEDSMETPAGDLWPNVVDITVLLVEQ